MKSKILLKGIEAIQDLKFSPSKISFNNLSEGNAQTMLNQVK